MNASQILSDDMTLDEKLEAINQAMANMNAATADKAKASGTPFVPLDPADLTMCEGCQ